MVLDFLPLTGLIAHLGLRKGLSLGNETENLLVGGSLLYNQ